MAVANLHKPQLKHAERIGLFALDALKAAQATMVDEEDPQRGCIRLRIGFHTGSVVANVIGTKNPRCRLPGRLVTGPRLRLVIALSSISHSLPVTLSLNS
jgi:class 3 adenylate cyclase